MKALPGACYYLQPDFGLKKRGLLKERKRYLFGNQVGEIDFRERCRAGGQTISLCVSSGGKRSYAIPSSHVVWQLLKLLLIFIRAGQSQKKVCFISKTF